MAYKPFVLHASPAGDDRVQSASHGGHIAVCVTILSWLGMPVNGYHVYKKKRDQLNKTSSGIKGIYTNYCSSRSRPVFNNVLGLILCEGDVMCSISILFLY
jgi:hypothetical protein